MKPKRVENYFLFIFCLWWHVLEQVDLVVNRGSICLYGLNKFQHWEVIISLIKCDEIINQFPKFNTTENWEWISNIVLYFNSKSDYLSMQGLKLIHVSKMGPWSTTETDWGMVVFLAWLHFSIREWIRHHKLLHFNKIAITIRRQTDLALRGAYIKHIENGSFRRFRH